MARRQTEEWSCLYFIPAGYTVYSSVGYKFRFRKYEYRFLSHLNISCIYQTKILITHDQSTEVQTARSRMPAYDGVQAEATSGL